jgi:hypothetical protein
MPFRLTNALAAFQKFMDCIFASLKCKYPHYLFWFMDDIIITISKPRSVISSKQKLEFLGYLITKGTIKIDPTKRHGLEEWPRVLKSIKEVCSTLGVLGYQRQFIVNFSHLAHPLNELLKKNKKFKWMEECMEAVNTLIKAVTSNLVLLCPDYKKPFVLEVDASQYAMGAILYQQDADEHW